MKRNKRRPLSLTKIYLIVFGVLSLLPLPSIIFAADSDYGLTVMKIPAVMFDVGICGLPRCETLLLSELYRCTLSEMVLYFAMPITALIFGIAVKRLVSKNEKCALVTKTVLVFLIAADIAVRLIPARFNWNFGTLFGIIGIVIRLACLALVALDLASDVKKKKAAALTEENSNA